MPSGKIARLLVIVLGLLVFPQLPHASESNPVPADLGTATLISAVEATGSLARIPLGLHITLPKGWKTYWRSPGDAGLQARGLC